MSMSPAGMALKAPPSTEISRDSRVEPTASAMRSPKSEMSVTSVQLPAPAVESAAISVRLPVPPSKAQVGPTPIAKVWMLVPAGTEPTSVLMSAPTMTD